VRHIAWGEGKLAGALGSERVLDLEDELALDYVVDLVELVGVQRGAAVCGGSSMSVMETWPPVSSLRSITLVVRFALPVVGMVLRSFRVSRLKTVVGCRRAGRPDQIARGVLAQELAVRHLR
jgi:hypothetical protein